MRALVLLCLLEAALIRPSLSNWDGPGTTGDSQTAGSVSECLSDPMSCGCCLMQNRIHTLEKVFQEKYDALHEEITKTKTVLDMKANHSAFSVSLNDASSLGCHGPFATDKPIVYKHIFINLRNDYDVLTGIFTAPYSGVYSLSLTIYTAHPSNIPAACAALQVNGQVVSFLSDSFGHDIEDSGTVVVPMKLNSGDQVFVILPNGCSICDDRNHHNTFTGFLLYAY